MRGRDAGGLGLRIAEEAGSHLVILVSGRRRNDDDRLNGGPQALLQERSLALSRCATGDRRPTADPLMDEVLQQVTEHRPRSWQRWIAHGQPAIRTVRTQLEAGWIIRVEHRRILPDRVELLDRIALQRYADEVRAELRRPASRTDPRTAAVLALAARGEISTVISRSERREHRQHLDELAVYTGPIADALRKAWRAKQAQQASG